MAFLLRRPFAVTATLRQLPRASSSTIRSFHQTPLKSNLQLLNTKTTTPLSLSASRNVFRATFRRSYQSQSVPNPTATGDLRQRLLYGAGIFGGALVLLNLVFNRETREDGGMPPFERKYLNDTFLHTGLGIGIIGVAATALHRNGWSIRLMTANPWLIFGVGLAGSIGTMIATRSIPPEK